MPFLPPNPVQQRQSTINNEQQNVLHTTLLKTSTKIFTLYIQHKIPLTPKSTYHCLYIPYCVKYSVHQVHQKSMWKYLHEGNVIYIPIHWFNSHFSRFPLIIRGDLLQTSKVKSNDFPAIVSCTCQYSSISISTPKLMTLTYKLDTDMVKTNCSTWSLINTDT